MKRLTIFLFLILLAAPLQAQFYTGNISAAGTTCTAGVCVETPLSDYGAAWLQVTGTFTATLQFEGTVDGATWFAVPANPITGAAVTSATAAGNWQFQAAGLSSFRVRASAYTSGVAIVAVRFSRAGFAPAGTATIAGEVTANAGTNLNTSALATQTTLSALNDKVPALGQALAAASVPVILPAATITTLTPPAAITGFATQATLALVPPSAKDILALPIRSAVKSATDTTDMEIMPADADETNYLVYLTIVNSSTTDELVYVCSGTCATEGNRTLIYLIPAGTSYPLHFGHASPFPANAVNTAINVGAADGATTIYAAGMGFKK